MLQSILRIRSVLCRWQNPIILPQRPLQIRHAVDATIQHHRRQLAVVCKRMQLAEEHFSEVRGIDPWCPYSFAPDCENRPKTAACVVTGSDWVDVHAIDDQQ